MYCVNENLDANLHFVFFFKFSIFPSVTPLQYIWTFVSVKDYLTKDSEIHTQLDSDELYYVAKNSHTLLISSFICSFFFLYKEISVADFSTPIGASVVKLYVHLKEAKLLK